MLLLGLSLLVFITALAVGVAGGDPNLFVPVCLVAAILTTLAFALNRMPWENK